VNEELLSKFLAGETTPAEAERVLDWLEASPANEAELDRLRMVWERSAAVRPQPTVNVDLAWQNVRKGMEKKPEIRPLPKRSWWPAAAAACVAVLAGMFWLLTRQAAPGTPMLVMRSGDAPRTFALPDGSKVTLNRHSSLEYPEQFAATSREVSLHGEGFFEVEKNPEKPFLVKTERTTVRVLGTSFNVREGKDNVDVVVETGRVEFSAGKKAVVLHPSERAVWQTGEDTIRRLPAPDRNMLSYRSRILLFNADPLKKVAETLTDYYGVSVVLKSRKIENCLWTVTIEDKPLDYVLGLLRESLVVRGITITKKDDGTVEIDGDGCDGSE
jgi:transmembrane sensor